MLYESPGKIARDDNSDSEGDKYSARALRVGNNFCEAESTEHSRANEAENFCGHDGKCIAAELGAFREYDEGCEMPGRFFGLHAV